MELSNQNKMLIVVGIVFCIALAVLSPYIASGDPDGLEKSAEDSSVAEDVESPVLEAPFPDYTYENNSNPEHSLHMNLLTNSAKSLFYSWEVLLL